MEGSPTPRQMAKGLLNGVAPPRPLFLPIVFSLGAKVENVPLGAFLGNPTKISSALRQMRSHLRSDGVACYFDPYLEIEALGARLERRSDDEAPVVHWPQAARVGELAEGLRSAEEAAQGGRVPVAAEVLRRMNALPNRDFLLMAGVTGPMTLAARMTQLEQNWSCEDLSLAVPELASSVVTQIATTFLEAGAELVMIQEEILPVFSAESCEAWASLLAPAINVIRFYEALPVLQFLPARSFLRDWEIICRQQWDCVVCMPAEALALRQSLGIPVANGAAFGIAIPLETFRQAGSIGEDFVVKLSPVNAALRPAIITTAGDVPLAADLKQLTKIFGEIPRAW
jgi:hypothetical protein